MGLYDRFAGVYSRGPYPARSVKIAQMLPAVLDGYHLPARGKLLDIACGEGTFAVSMAQQGWQVTAVDQSSSMLEYARPKVGGLPVDFLCQNMNQLVFESQFDLATCWFDSLNYLLEFDDLTRVFAGVSRALKPGGMFLFDMNTLYGLAVDWQRQACYVQQDTDDLLELHRSSYNFERQTASVQITAFLHVGEVWERFEEVHQERGYPVEDIQASLKEVGLNVLACMGNLFEDQPLTPNSPRVWFAARRSN